MKKPKGKRNNRPPETKRIRKEKMRIVDEKFVGIKEILYAEKGCCCRRKVGCVNLITAKQKEHDARPLARRLKGRDKGYIGG